MAEKYWSGSKPVQCQIPGCGTKLHGEFVDGKTTHGPWGLMCPRCHRLYGMGLGKGKGQKYRLDPQTRRFLKVAG
jgi:hypothetical protein